ADQLNYRGPCPVTINFTGQITAPADFEGSYRFARSDDVLSDTGVLRFDLPGTKTVSTSWTLGASGQSSYSGWVALWIVSMGNLVSEPRADFRITCERGGELKLNSLDVNFVTGANKKYKGDPVTVDVYFNGDSVAGAGPMAAGQEWASGSSHAAHVKFSPPQPLSQCRSIGLVVSKGIISDLGGEPSFILASARNSSSSGKHRQRRRGQRPAAAEYPWDMRVSVTLNLSDGGRHTLTPSGNPVDTLGDANSDSVEILLPCP
ncbi:MAG TPA: hypothetical protein VE642_12195, partial [Pyrinomonadaceae bacterium]|nr:hypothetical protein [Pyrinomonadaceae bacterium]